MKASRILCVSGFLALLVIAGSSCSSGSSSSPAAPGIGSTVPEDAGTDVVLNAVLAAVFDTDMDPTTIDDTTYTVSETGSGTPVTGTVTYDAPTRTATFTPDTVLTASLDYTATLSTGIKNDVGTPLGAAFSWTFTTGTTTDSTPPTVTAMSPADAATGVAVDVDITATFDESMLPSTINGTTFTVTGGGSVAGTVTYDEGTLTATFNPTSDLSELTTYTATITTGAQDTAGNGLAGDVVWTFTTADLTPPSVTTQSPAAGATSVAVTTSVTATFSEDMDAGTIDGTSFTLNPGPVTGSVIYDAPTKTATFTPDSNLTENTTYTATVTTGAQDVAGNGLAADVSWQFTTVADATPPTLTGQFPAASATNISTITLITATFNEPLDPATVTGANFQVNSGAVTGTVTYDGPTRTATFTPDAALSPNTLHTVTISTSITDAAGNAFAGTTWDFTTGAGADVTPPTVTSWSPDDADTNVSVATHQLITFSEAMNKPSVEAAFSITPSLANPEQFFWNGTSDQVTVVFDTTNPPGVEGDDILAENQGYTVELAGTAEDLAGNTLTLTSISWTTQPDVTAPQLVSTTPDTGTTVSAATSTLVVTFDESMDQTDGRVEVTSKFETSEWEASIGFSTSDLSIAWTSATDLEITFSSGLVANTSYEIELDVRDTAGNEYDDNEAVRLFLVTTGSDTGSPSVMATMPAAGATGVPGDSYAFVAFSRTMGADIVDHVSITGNGATEVDFARTVDPPGVFMRSKQALPPSTLITISVAATASDASGNTLGSAFNLTFTTAAANSNSWGAHAAYNALQDGDTDIDPNFTGEAFLFADSTGARVIMNEQTLASEQVSLVDQATGIPVKGYVLRLEEEHLSVEPQGVIDITLAESTTYELSFNSGLLNSHGVAITPETIAFTTASPGTTRPHVVVDDLTLELDIFIDERQISAHMRASDADGDGLNVNIASDVDVAFSEMLTETFGGSDDYEYDSASDETELVTVGEQPFTVTVDDLSGNPVVFKRRVWNFGLSGVPVPTSPTGGASVPGGAPTYTFSVPASTTAGANALALLVMDSGTGDPVLFTFLPVGTTSFTHPADNPLPAGGYISAVGAVRFEPGIARGEIIGAVIGISGNPVDFIVP